MQLVPGSNFHYVVQAPRTRNRQKNESRNKYFYTHIQVKRPIPARGRPSSSSAPTSTQHGVGVAAAMKGRAKGSTASKKWRRTTCCILGSWTFGARRRCLSYFRRRRHRCRQHTKPSAGVFCCNRNMCDESPDWSVGCWVGTWEVICGLGRVASFFHTFSVTVSCPFGCSLWKRTETAIQMATSIVLSFRYFIMFWWWRLFFLPSHIPSIPRRNTMAIYSWIRSSTVYALTWIIQVNILYYIVCAYLSI